MVKREDEDGNAVYRKEPVWNWVVANISLLAVGSSSPEILLVTVEAIVSLGKEPGENGPACIIGSGAYNLFAITAVITAVLPAGSFKRVEHQKVFIWTTTWSIWAHIWVWLIYKKITPNVIDLWEGLVTLGMFPALVFTAWLVDTRGWNWFGRNRNQVVPSNRGESDKASLIADEELGNAHPMNEDSQIETISAGPVAKSEKSAMSLGGALKTEKSSAAVNDLPRNKKSILYYRHMAVQNVLGGKTKQVEVKETNIESTINMDELRQWANPIQRSYSSVQRCQSSSQWARQRSRLSECMATSTPPFT